MVKCQKESNIMSLDLFKYIEKNLSEMRSRIRITGKRQKMRSHNLGVSVRDVDTRIKNKGWSILGTPTLHRCFYS